MFDRSPEPQRSPVVRRNAGEPASGAGHSTRARPEQGTQAVGKAGAAAGVSSAGHRKQAQLGINHPHGQLGHMLAKALVLIA